MSTRGGPCTIRDDWLPEKQQERTLSYHQLTSINNRYNIEDHVIVKTLMNGRLHLEAKSPTSVKQINSCAISLHSSLSQCQTVIHTVDIFIYTAIHYLCNTTQHYYIPTLRTSIFRPLSEEGPSGICRACTNASVNCWTTGKISALAAPWINNPHTHTWVHEKGLGLGLGEPQQ